MALNKHIYEWILILEVFVAKVFHRKKLDSVEKDQRNQNFIHISYINNYYIYYLHIIVFLFYLFVWSLILVQIC